MQLFDERHELGVEYIFKAEWFNTRCFRGRLQSFISELVTATAMGSPLTAATGVTLDGTAVATCWNERFMANVRERKLVVTVDCIVRQSKTK